MDGPHSSHVTRMSDASTYDEVCVNCGACDEVPGGWGRLAHPCPKPVGQGGVTIEEYYRQLRERNESIVLSRTEQFLRR